MRSTTPGKKARRPERGAAPAASATWRPARPRDRRRVVELSRAFYREDPSSVPVPARTAATLARLRAEPVRGRAMVLEDGEGRVEGYALLISYWSNELGGELVAVDEIYVAPALRGRGLAASLIVRIETDRAVWPRRPAVVELEVSPKNTRARALYERLGFTEIRNATLRKVLVRRRGA